MNKVLKYLILVGWCSFLLWIAYVAFAIGMVR